MERDDCYSIIGRDLIEVTNTVTERITSVRTYIVIGISAAHNRSTAIRDLKSKVSAS